MPNPVRSAFIYLMQLAWKSRLHIPFLLTVCFLVFDIRLQLEVNINMTRRRAPRLIAGDHDNNDNYGGVNNVDFNIDDEDDDDDDNDDEEEDDDENNSNNGRASGVMAEENNRADEPNIEKITIVGTSSLSRNYNGTSKVLFVRPSVFQQLNHALEKHYQKKSIQSFKTVPSVVFKSYNSPISPRCVL